MISRSVITAGSAQSKRTAPVGWPEVITHVRMVEAVPSQAVVLASSSVAPESPLGTAMAAVSAWTTSPASITVPVPARYIKRLLEVHRRCIEGAHTRADGRGRRNYAAGLAIAPTRHRGRGWTPIRAPDVRCPVPRGSREVLSPRPCGCRLFIRAGQAACRYSWRMPPSRSRLRTSRCAIRSGSVSGSGSGRRGAAARSVRSVRWGRCSL
jgi:hypothetical protein